MNCRVCYSATEDILDLGAQCLGGQFPQDAEPDPPRFPLVLAHCKDGCGLVQLRDTVDPRLMFTDYWYRSGVTETMRTHLAMMATEAAILLGRPPERVLDIGANDGTLLSRFIHLDRWGVDPSDLPMSPGETRIKGFYPHQSLKGQKFDLIFTVACFYDVNDPVAFVEAIHDNLAADGLWVVEVADLANVLGGAWNAAWDAICHEHLTYWDIGTFWQCCRMANLNVVKWERNSSNGGSLRFYVSRRYDRLQPPPAVPVDGEALRMMVAKAKEDLRALMVGCRVNDLRVHLLGASTKANTWLQYCGFTTETIEFASDRDLRKRGTRTPGSNIPIVSEEESRMLRPDVYVVGPWHFKQEIVEREKEHLERGGKLVFPLPKLEVVG